MFLKFVKAMLQDVWLYGLLRDHRLVQSYYVILYCVNKTKLRNDGTISEYSYRKEVVDPCVVAAILGVVFTGILNALMYVRNYWATFNQEKISCQSYVITR